MLLLALFQISAVVNALTNNIKQEPPGALHVAVELPKKAPHLLDLLQCLSDKPKGAYVELMSPVIMAAALGYNITEEGRMLDGPSAHKTATHRTQLFNYRREYNLERKPNEFGVHARIFIKDNERRIIVSLRGSCTDLSIRQCRADSCFLKRAGDTGYLPEDVVTDASTPCTEEFKPDELDYLGQARTLVQRIRQTYPTYAVLLTGHAMGGHLAILTAAQQPHEIQALGISPSPFHKTMRYQLGFSVLQIKSLPKDNLISYGDAYDLGINTALLSDARDGSITCVVHSADMPDACKKLRNDMKIGSSLTSASEWNTTDQCKQAVHSIGHYSELLEATIPIIPICRRDLSTLSGWNVKIDFASAGKNIAGAGFTSFRDEVNKVLNGDDI